MFVAQFDNMFVYYDKVSDFLNITLPVHYSLTEC